jgi:DNA relaxase NicK
MQTLTKIDRLGLSVTGGQDVVRGFLGETFRHIGTVAYELRNGGHGFQHSALATVGGAQVAWMAWGGASQKGRSFVDVSGLGCTLVDDWRRVHSAISGLPGVTAKRVDIAADFYRGEVTYDDTLAAYRAGRFTRSGRPPAMSQILPGGEHEGRTVYIGKRGNDVMLRGYEKGKKEFADLPRSIRSAGIGCISGVDDAGQSFGLDDWFRLELELRAKTRQLPLDVIPDRDQYFAGAYPYLQDVLPGVEPEVLVRPEHIAEANLEKALALIQRQWGSTLFTALTCYGGDIFSVWSRICGRDHNERLVSTGALLLADKFSGSNEVATVAGSQARH